MNPSKDVGYRKNMVSEKQYIQSRRCQILYDMKEEKEY